MKPYWFFKLTLYPFLPFLVHEASKIQKNRKKLPPLSEHLTLGNGGEKIIIFGESTAAGIGASSREKTLAGNFSILFGKDYEVENLGKNGLTLKHSLDFFKKQKKEPALKLTGIMLFFGANDCFRLTGPKVFQKELQNLISFFTSNYSPDWIYLSDIPPVHLFPAFSFLLRGFLKIQREYLQHEMFRVSKENQNIIFEPISFQFEPDFFSEDKIHPSDIGYGKIAKFAMKNILEKGWIKKEPVFEKD